LKITVYTVLILILSACSGTGIKNFSTTNSLIMDETKGRVFVGREFTASTWAEKWKIYLNGQQIGKLGGGETLTEKFATGSNTLQAEFGGLIDLDIGKDAFSFKGVAGTNRYFIVSKKLGLFTNALRVMEVTEDGFKNAMRD